MLLLGFDNWKSGRDGEGRPQSGYCRSTCALILGGASLFGLCWRCDVRSLVEHVRHARPVARVPQVFVPRPFVLLMQWLGLDVASFLLIAGFMRVVGRIAPWNS